MEKVIDRRVRRFALALWRALEADAWGDIEPEVFENIGRGLSSGDFVYNKYSREEMETAVACMKVALRTALKGL